MTNEEKFKLEIQKKIADFFWDPLSYVLYNWEWGKGELEGFDGPDPIQREILEDIRVALKSNPGKVVKIGVSSGHGIGKSTLISWIIKWFMSTRQFATGVTTANTKTQLETKTIAELIRWHGRSLDSFLFDLSATRYAIKQSKKKEVFWQNDFIPWSENKAEAFAGTHSKYLLYTFDESSTIADVIFETANGAFTQVGVQPGAQGIFLVFGNPTRNNGFFYDIFNGNEGRSWVTHSYDSRKSKLVSKDWWEDLIKTYGVESDYVKVRVLGQFPEASDLQLIPTNVIIEAMKRDYSQRLLENFPRIIGVDVARQGNNKTVMARRQGKKIWPLEKLQQKNQVQVAGWIARKIDEFKADAIFIDQGYGVGVIDILRNLGYQNIVEVPFGSESSNDKYLNKRTEMCFDFKDWLVDGGAIPNDKDLKTDCIGTEYTFAKHGIGKLMIERKKDMKQRGFESTDCLDSCILTFAHPVHVDRNVSKIFHVKEKYHPLDHRPGDRYAAA